MPQRLIAAGLISLLLGLAPAFADYPDKPIHVIVPFAAGGGVDVMARLFAEKAAPVLGVPVIVENRAGASGTIGGLTVKQSPPDGYTLLFAPLTHVMANRVLKSVPYSALDDFTTIARVAETPNMAVMSIKMPQTTLSEVAAAARANPAEWTVATSGLGSSGHVLAIQFRNLSKADLTITPYRGTAPALTDVMGGHVQLLFDAMITLLPPARSGKVRALAISTEKRSALAPEVPTAAESGMPELTFTSWLGFFGPKGVPQDVVTKLNTTMTAAGKALAAEQRLALHGAEPVAETPDDFARFVRAQVERNSKILDSAGFQPQ